MLWTLLAADMLAEMYENRLKSGYLPRNMGCF